MVFKHFDLESASRHVARDSHRREETRLNNRDGAKGVQLAQDRVSVCRDLRGNWIFPVSAKLISRVAAIHGEIMGLHFRGLPNARTTTSSLSSWGRTTGSSTPAG